jgi:hypothetical protein
LAEFEELKVTVSVVDKTSANLRDVNTQITRVTGDTGKKLSEQFKSSADVVTKYGTELRSLANSFGLFGNLPIFRLGSGAGLLGGATAIVTSIKMMNDALANFSKELLALRDMSRSAGLLPDQFKNISNQLRLVGYSSGQAATEITNFFRTIEEAARPGTAQFQRIWSQSFNPEVTLARIRQMRDMIRQGQPGRAIATAATEARAIYERELHRPGGGGMQEARRQAENWLASIGLSMRAMGITDISDFLGDPTKWQRRIEAAERFNAEYEKFNRIISGIINQIKEDLLPLFKDLNEGLSKGGAGGSFFSILGSDAEDLRKILALLEGDWQKFASLLPVGGAMRNLIMGNPMRGGEVQGPPTAFGEPPLAPGGQPRSEGAGPIDLTPEQVERLKRRMGRRSDATKKDNEQTQQSIQQNNSLLEQIKRLKDILFQSEVEADQKKAAAAAGAKTRGEPPHNRPMGGAHGESNPIQLSSNAPHPGGGAAFEARQPTGAGDPGAHVLPNLIRPAGAGEDPYPWARFKDKPFPIIPPDATRLVPKQDYKPSDPSGGGAQDVPGGRGLATWFSRGTDPSGKLWGDPSARDAPSSNVLGVADPYQGISLPSKSTVGDFYYVKDPNTGLTHVIQQSDVGPGVRTQKLVDVSVAKLSQLGYTQKSFEDLQDKRLWDVAPTGFGRGTPTRKYDPSGTQEISQDTADVKWKEMGGAFDEEGTPSDVLEKMGLRKPGGRDPTMEKLLEPGGGGFGGGGATGTTSLDRGLMNRALASESSVDASANLDVNVRGPAGVETKVSGDGMFAGNTSLNRQVELM